MMECKAPHLKPLSAYQNRGCRCERCVQTKRQYSLSYYQKNKTKIRERDKKLRDENLGQYRAKEKASRERNKEARSAARKKRYRENNHLERYGHIAAIRGHKDRHLEFHNKRSRLRLLEIPEVWLGTPNEDLIIEIFKNRPIVDGVKYHVDHMRPMSKGGQFHENNLAYIPPYYNASKRDKSIEEFGQELYHEKVIYWQDVLAKKKE